MKCTLELGGRGYQFNLTQPIDISLPLAPHGRQVNAWYAPPFSASPVRMGDFIGSVAAGGPVNFVNVSLNPHGNGTHTECVGHISAEPYTINKCLCRFWFMARVVSIYPQAMDDGDKVITLQGLQQMLDGAQLPEALIIRTLPNDDLKATRQYSDTNPPYLHHDAIEWMVHQGVNHLLLDLPSVDREQDGGALAGHKAFWQYPGAQVRQHATITELIYVPNEVEDGLYLLNIQIPPFELDAAPSKPALYRLETS